MEKYELLRENVPHGNAMFPLMVHILTNEQQEEERIHCHWHEELEFFLLKEGNAVLSIGEQSYAMQAGDFALIRSNQLHALNAEKGERISFIAIDFAQEFLFSFDNDKLQQQYFAQMRYEKIVFQEFYHADSGWRTDVWELLLALCAFFEKAEPGYELQVKAKLYEIFGILYAHAVVSEEAHRKDRRAEQTKEIIEYLQKHYERAITMEELSSNFHMSTGHLCRLFKAITGHSVVDYLNDYRVRVSARLLLESELDIGEIAMQSGFNNISYYNKRFRQYMHQTPSEYRRKLHKNTE